jgi:hypothetical protein
VLKSEPIDLRTLLPTPHHPAPEGD